MNQHLFSLCCLHAYDEGYLLSLCCPFMHDEGIEALHRIAVLCGQVWEKWTPEMDRAEEEEEQGPASNPSAPKEVLQVC